MALKGLDIFKITPKKNCKECGCPTCMAFSMKVAQGALAIEKCPYISADVIGEMSEATAPPMKTIKFGVGDSEHQLGGETVLQRHDKTFVSKTIYAVSVCDAMSDDENAAVFASIPAVDYERIGERMYVEAIYVNHVQGKDADKYLALVKKALELGRALILSCADPALAKSALELAKGTKPILSGANAQNYNEMNALAVEYEAVLGVVGEELDEIYDTVAAIEKLGNKNLVINVGTKSIKDAFSKTVQIRRAAIMAEDRTFGYPTIVSAGRLSGGNKYLQAALASLFTMKYGSVVVLDGMDYAQALPLYGLRQNIFTDPQKPMRVEPGIYPINGGNEDSICLTTVDFALTYFVVSGELERSGVPVNLLISDAGGYSVLTAWAAGKLSASSIAKFISEFEIESKIKNRILVLPGKVAVLKGELQDKLPDWQVVVGPQESIELVRFLQQYK